MINNSKFLLIAIIVYGLSACNQSIEEITADLSAKAIKMDWVEACGEGQNCRKTVEDKFDQCYELYGNFWRKSIESPEAEQEGLISIFSKKMFSCLVDETGNSVLVFEDEA